ncbi:MAG: DEAD/DEAH box helicase [Opitutales bacterium]|nr:DEAD/DEAH box helicase [Opitutales bacterium]
MKELLENLNASRLAAYRACPRDILEHAGKEESVSAGGYGYRQILELVQNGADAILEAQQNSIPDPHSRIEVRLTDSHVYVANTGAPLSEQGLEALLSSDLSPKRGNQIGRFGLGFKSLLRLGGVIDLFTRANGNIRFDPERCCRELRDAFSTSKAPGLRLAWPLDITARAADPVLESLAWAETVVRAEVCAPGLREHLDTEIREFPREFLLFLDHPVELKLATRTAEPVVLRVEHQNDIKILHSGAEQTRWRVFSREVTMEDQDAAIDATSIHARKIVPLAWATPLDTKREEAGRFWAFFPTHTPTYLQGILNAPWKLNSDRNSLVRGEWNTALMRAAAELVVERLPTLSTPDDPGRLLDAFPRQPERQDDDAVPMINAIWQALMEAEILPDAAGTLRSPKHLLRPPRDDRSLAEQWQSLSPPEGKARVVHASCLERLRSSRLNALADRLRPKELQWNEVPPLSRAGAAGWFAVVASSDTPKALKVLRLAEAFHEACSGQEWSKTQASLRIIPTEDGGLATSGEVVIVPQGTHTPEGRKAVASSLAATAEGRRILAEIFHVGGLDDGNWRKILTESLPDYRFSNGWEEFWTNLRSAPEHVAQRFIADKRAGICVRARSGSWKGNHEVLLPGEIVREDDTTQNSKVLVHAETHALDHDRLTKIGVADCPSLTEEEGVFDGLTEWLGFWRKHFRSNNNQGRRPQAKCLNPQGLSLPIATRFLSQITGPANARLTFKLLPLLDNCPQTCSFGHDTSHAYPKIDVPHPLPWLLLRHGTVMVGGMSVQLRAYVHRAAQCTSALSAVPNLLPPLSASAIERLRAHTEPPCAPPTEEIRGFWRTCIRAVSTPDRLKDDGLSPLWSAAARDDVVPEAFLTASGEVPLSAVFVTSSPDLARRVRNPDRIVITLDEHALHLWQTEGARPLADLVKPEWDGVTGPDLLLLDAIPELAPVLTNQASIEARCQPVDGLCLVVGEGRDALPCLMWEDRLLLDLVGLRTLPRHDRFASLLRELASAGWLTVSMEEALRIIADATVEAQRAAVAAAPDLPARLLAAVEERPEPLRAALGGLANQPFVQGSTLRQLAELVLAHHGPATLSHLRDALEESGLQPPRRWNTAEARTFVTAIGFPESFADASAARREPEEWITGPIELPPLHDFQEEVFDGVRSLLASAENRRRAVVSLPTGGGKTRVTVEAAVRLVLAPPGGRRSVIWIAQSDELCEQAVQAFRQVWLNLGAQRTELRIVRLWGGNPNPAPQETDKPLVIVASIQTLNARMGGAALEWLQQPGLVVVDECHHAITPSYTNLLRWLDAEARPAGAPPRDEPPILGLSATPFRMDDDESRRLAARFGKIWLPGDQADLHHRLRTQGVLAEIDSEALRSRASLTDEETSQFDRHREQMDGLDFERMLEALNQRLAGVEERNQQILECVQQAPQRSILLFANSIDHATELSARLNLLGIPSASISGDTPRVSRRYFLEKFQRGDLRVLCNHSVLSTGFDAPRTDMLLIARQIFSPVRYMQIVGRGLRGEKNGGTPRCRIVTVLDNLGRFQDRHPYHYCADYFRALNAEATESLSA